MTTHSLYASLIVYLFDLFFGSSFSQAFVASKIYTAAFQKNKEYVSEGLIIGGRHTIDGIKIKNIRRAPNDSFERVVIDLESTQPGEILSHPPYYQLAMIPEERQLVMTIWGHAQLEFNPKIIPQKFQKSPVIQKIDFIPPLEPENQPWTFVLNLRGPAAIEVFELTESQPIRIIIDIQKKQI